MMPPGVLYWHVKSATQPTEVTTEGAGALTNLHPLERPTWALERLQPPTAAQLRLAHRSGLDPNTLLEQFNEQYNAAFAHDAATIDALVGDTESCGSLYCELWDHLNEVAEDRHYEWWIGPRLEVARLLNPAATARDLQGVERMLRSQRTFGHLISLRPRRHSSRSRLTALRPQGRGRTRRPAERRIAKVASGDDPGDADGELAPAAAPRAAGRGRT